VSVLSIEALQSMIDESHRIVFFGGAGVSTESGLKDFRSEDGLYREKYKYSPEVMLSHSFFKAHPDEFFGFYRDKLLCPDVRPTAAHLKLAELERAGKLSAVVTQNIDGLHQMAGSQNVIELHGSVHRNYCVKCHKHYDLEYILGTTGVPHCACGGIIRPDVVLYEEPLDADMIDATVCAISEANMLIVGGTSLAVYPAAGLIDYYDGDKLVLINKQATAYDRRANLRISGPIGQTLSQITV
jgi:NAD-dependent deacetylase